MHPAELFGLIVFALMFFTAGVFAVREGYKDRHENKKLLVWCGIVFVFFGLPTLAALRAMGS